MASPNMSKNSRGFKGGKGRSPAELMSAARLSELDQRAELGDRLAPMVMVKIPTPLRVLTTGKDEVSANGSTVRELIEDLEKNYAGLKDRLCDAQGVRRFINIYANDEDIRFLDGLDTKLSAGDSVSIVPAIAGG